jgi:hypothetical protein
VIYKTIDVMTTSWFVTVPLSYCAMTRQYESRIQLEHELFTTTQILFKGAHLTCPLEHQDLSEVATIVIYFLEIISIWHHVICNAGDETINELFISDCKMIIPVTRLDSTRPARGMIDLLQLVLADLKNNPADHVLYVE